MNSSFPDWRNLNKFCDLILMFLCVFFFIFVLNQFCVFECWTLASDYIHLLFDYYRGTAANCGSCNAMMMMLIVWRCLVLCESCCLAFLIFVCNVSWLFFGMFNMLITLIRIHLQNNWDINFINGKSQLAIQETRKLQAETCH